MNKGLAIGIGIAIIAIAIAIGFSQMEETATEPSVEVSEEPTTTEGKDYQVTLSDEAGAGDQP